eukprot:m.565274 g.565274  ORF g.565274 m.565274 type:complete len:576 (+) comp22241_c1_seq8:242-1969(+)
MTTHTSLVVVILCGTCFRKCSSANLVEKSHHAFMHRIPGRIKHIEKSAAEVDDVHGASGNHYSTPLTGFPEYAFHVNLSVGSPPGNVVDEVVVDTGSSNLAIAGSTLKQQHPYLHVFTPSRSPTAKEQSKTISVKYVAGSFSAEIYQDIIGFADITPGYLNCTAQFGLITQASNFFPDTTYQTEVYGFDGILGLAYRTLASDNIEPLFPTFVGEGKIGNEFSIQLCTSDLNYPSGTGSAMFLGGIPGDYTNDIRFTPLTAEIYYSVQVLGMKLGSKTMALTCGDFNSPSASIVDSGTTDLLLPQKVFDAIVAELYLYLPAELSNASKKQYFYPGNDKIAIPQVYAAKFPTLSITFPVAGNPHEAFDVVLQPSDYLLLRYSNKDEVTWMFAMQPVCISQSGSTLGIPLFSASEIVFDRANKQVGFSPTSCNRSPMPYITAPYAIDPTGYMTDCTPSKICASPSSKSMTNTILQVCGIVFAVVGVLLFAYSCWGRKTLRDKRARSRIADNDDDNDDDALLAEIEHECAMADARAASLRMAHPTEAVDVSEFGAVNSGDGTYTETFDGMSADIGGTYE